MENMKLDDIAIRCESFEEARSAIEFFINNGYKLPLYWDVCKLALCWHQYPDVATNIMHKYEVTSYSIGARHHKSVFSYSEFFSNKVECSDYDMIL